MLENALVAPVRDSHFTDEETEIQSWEDTQLVIGRIGTKSRAADQSSLQDCPHTAQALQTVSVQYPQDK